MKILLCVFWLLVGAVTAEAACSNPLAAAGGSTCSHVGATWTCSDTGDDCNNGDALANALATAACGDTIVLSAGVSYQTRAAFLNGADAPIGNPFFLSTVCSAGNPITVKSSALASISPTHRVGPADAANLAQLASNNSSQTIMATGGPVGWVLQGLDITNTAFVNPTHHGLTTQIVQMSTTTYGGWAQDIIFDRVWIHPYDDTPNPARIIRTAQTGIVLEGVNMTIKNSSIMGFCCFAANTCYSGSGCVASDLQSSEAIIISLGPGPVTLHNNLIEAFGWNIFTGGAGGDPGSAMVNPANTATITSATLTQATFSQVATLLVGDYVAFVIPGGWTTTSACGGNGAFGYVVKVDTINTGTKLVTYHGVGCESIDDAVTTQGNPLPPNGSTAQWRGAQLSGMTVTRNTFSKRTDWCDGTYPAGKSIWEMKQGSNILFEGNTVTVPVHAPPNGESWPGAGVDTGCAPMNLTFATSERGNVPWVRGDGNVFRNNLFRGIGRFVAFQGYQVHSIVPPAAGLTFTNNLLDATPRSDFLDTGVGYTNGWVFTHNTVRGQTGELFFDSCFGGICATQQPTAYPISGMVFRDNLISTGTYGFTATNPYTVSYPSLVENHNVFIRTQGIGAPPWNGFTPDATSVAVANDAAVGFVNVTAADAGGDYHGWALAGASPYKNAASDGTDIGVNFQQLDAALGAVTSGCRGGCKVKGGGKLK